MACVLIYGPTEKVPSVQAGFLEGCLGQLPDEKEASLVLGVQGSKKA